MSSRVELATRAGPLVLFVLAVLGSAFAYRGILPVFGAPATPPSVSRPADAAMAMLGSAQRPFERVTLCQPLAAYVPDRAPLAPPAETVENAPFRPVILCSVTAADFAIASARAQREGLVWSRLIGATDMMAFAADEANFRDAMGRAGLALSPGALHAFSPMLGALHSNMPGVVQESQAWRIPAHGDDALMLFGPYQDLAAGPYRVRLHARLEASPDRCRIALNAFKPQLAATQDAGRGEIHARAPAALAIDAGDPCAFTLQDMFTPGPGGAKAVETPFYGAVALPMLVDGYVLEPAAQSR